jgi:hypothetical protein
LAGDSDKEVILAEEEAVICRGTGLLQEVESDFDVGKETEGNLVLTNRRLIYSHGAETEVDVPVGGPNPFAKRRLYISDVRDLDDIPSDPENLTIPIESVISAVGHHKLGLAPKLEVRWNKNGLVKATEFVEQETGGSRLKNLNEWAGVIEGLKTGQQKFIRLPPPPDKNSLEGQVFYILGDMSEKGVFTILGEVEKEFSLDLDDEVLEKACENLVVMGLVKRLGEPKEDPFYQKISALGAEDLDQ